MKKFAVKRVFIIFFAFIISFSVYLAQNNTINPKREIGDAVQVTSLPVSGKVVVLDAGHGTPDEGGSLLHQVKNRSNYFFIKNNCRCKSLQFF